MINPVQVSRRAALGALGAMGAGIAAPGLARAAVPPIRSTTVSFLVPLAMPNAAELAGPSQVRLDGWLGQRVTANATRRLMTADLEPLLAGYRRKPGSHSWIGEHIGKWMHAASLAWAGNGDAALKRRLDYAAGSLIEAQEPDGYLGTYLEPDRMALKKHSGWDVWSHKYCLLGLLTYYRHTGNAAALAAARKAGDLLTRTFPQERSILKAGHFNGLAATSVLEPMVLLYRHTAERRYLQFARYIVKAWEEEGGPNLVEGLLTHGKVSKIPSAKAYEMLSNIVGMCQIGRVTGEARLVNAAKIAWQDIVASQLFPSGTTSESEFFQPDSHMAEEHMARVGETCVTTTWIQLNQLLFEITGDARYGNELERTYYNALAAAQHPDGEDWCYFTPLNGKKKYDRDITCCHSSGPRGMALAPLSAYLTAREDGAPMLLVSTLEASSADLMVGRQNVRVEQASGFPEKGVSRLRLRLKEPARFGVKVRVPAWAMPLTIAGATVRDGWAHIPPRRWRNGDEVLIGFALGSEMRVGTGYHAERQMVSWGPFLLAYETKANESLPPTDMIHYSGPATLKADDQFLRFEAPVSEGEAPLHHPGQEEKPLMARLVTYADAGANGSYYRVWLRRLSRPDPTAGAA